METLDQSVTLQQSIQKALRGIPATQQAEDSVIHVVERLAEELRQQEAPTKNGKWAAFALRVHNESPLRGMSQYIQESSREFREDFAISKDEAE